MTKRFIRKLETFSPLSEDDKSFLISVTQQIDHLASDTDIIREGDKPNDIRLVESGFACRYKLLSSGRRQIVGYLFPGDICDLHASLLDQMDHSIGTVAACGIVRIKRSDIEALLDRPAVARALLMVTLVNESIGRDWLANIGGRRAEQRLGHLFCEWHARLSLVGLADGNECEFPLTQLQIGDTLGLTSVHVNRSLQNLRSEKLITLRGRRLVIMNLPRLVEMSGFDLNYLHTFACRIRK